MQNTTVNGYLHFSKKKKLHNIKFRTGTTCERVVSLQYSSLKKQKNYTEKL